MPKIYEAANVEEAVMMATKFQDEGKYDWFRGQAKDWIPHSSLYRLRGNEELISKAKSDFNIFINWLNNKEELKYLLKPENRHQLEAILQHYGFPTDYIDFTTEPSIAGFFACDTNSPPTDGKSCIYCLDTEDLMSFWEDIKDFDSRKGAQIDKVIVDVSNLWRLQAQYGVFLFVNYNWEIDYPLDKIVFPYIDYPSYPTKEIIYPDHKSPLEILLDEFFDKQRSIHFFSKWAPLFHTVHDLTPFPEGYNIKAFNNVSELKFLQSWDEKERINWKKYKIEEYHKTAGSSQKLSLKGRTSENDIKNLITYGVQQMLRSNKFLRTKAIEWILEGVDSNLDAKKICNLLTKIWSGMRLLPFSDEEISIACGNLIYLHLKKVNLLERNLQIEVFKELFGEGSIVGFSIKEGNGAVGFASKKNLLDALGYDFSDLLIDKLKGYSNEPKELFKFIYNPKLMFDFDKFKKIFAQEIIPTQISIYDSYVIYNPFEIIIFGNP